ncbi:hypothetical protein C7C46_06505 [Streptomyces tateyamensis]|uniref:DUF2771 domain-containing protein n=1 Tax=Streptomyces tateyamensis TaxID=565073 RepID=A0A2V4PIL3_9ACTN|nr:hypothetical protein [Streptomyces tateyamensis]PYC85389.1 hypothetical protein C7C46_06505 [Streptomyces tateyamensis]
MSLSTPVIAALGAVAVIGAGTLGGSIAFASTKDKPLTSQATVTVGRNSFHLEPTCYNAGKPFDDNATKACGLAAAQTDKLKSISVSSVDRIGVGVDKQTAANGWRADTNGGNSQSGAPIAAYQKDNTFSGMQPAVNVLSQVRNTRLTVVEFDPKTADSNKPGILAVWFVNLKNSAAPAAPAQSQDASQGQGPSQGQ